MDGRPRVDAELTPDALVVRCHGLAVPGALRRSVTVPRDGIAGARLVPRREATEALGWKVGGTFLTRSRFIGGVFTVRGAKGARQWWAAPAGDPVLVIDLRDHRWSRIVVRLEGDQEALATRLAAPREV